MSAPAEGTMIVEPVSNGWLVTIFDDDLLPDIADVLDQSEDDEEDDEEDELGYDPELVFGKGPTQEKVVHEHIHVHGCGGDAEPSKFVFLDHLTMLAFLGKHARRTDEKRIELDNRRKSRLNAKAQKERQARRG